MRVRRKLKILKNNIRDKVKLNFKPFVSHRRDGSLEAMGIEVFSAKIYFSRTPFSFAIYCVTNKGGFTYGVDLSTPFSFEVRRRFFGINLFCLNLKINWEGEEGTYLARMAYNMTKYELSDIIDDKGSIKGGE